ncbi:hypothetical protein GOP47_0016469 [Adiantum capillus-veneris]|uniref:Glycosyltransferase n=1 Tax=Adiantum capillus-veneris TaxID=13818 RepID=A0A9D4ZAS0_ADICA|nr:hypothetical protein GOP47_0016469 [Adiantum capillus-veneris]
MAGSKPHAVVFPFPTQGHINPLMLLAERLLDSGISVTFVHTARTSSMLQKSQQNPLSYEGADQGLHESCPDAELYIEVLPDAVSADNRSTPVSPSVALFMSSIPVMRTHFESLILRLREVGRPPSCIIGDSFLPWIQDVADHFNIPRIEFWSSTATVYSMGFCIPSLLSNGYLPVPSGTDPESTIDVAPGTGPCRLADFFYDLTYYPVTSPVFEFLQAAFVRCKEAQRVLVHSMDHLEKDVIHALHKEGIPMDPIGPLLDLMDGSTAKVKHKELRSMSLLKEDKDSLEWLDTHPKSSVIYASFGSNVKISLQEIQELALGLEESQQPFLLVIRPDLVPNGTHLDALPDKFAERIEGRGRVSSWVPQRAVLAHPSVGGFFSHCGWNSVLESMWMGVPIIGSPRESEQNTNLKCLLDWKAAIAVDAKHSKVYIKRDLVKKAIKTLMQEPEGEVVRRRMVELKEEARFAIERGQSRSNLQKLVEDIRRMASEMM